MKKIAFVLCLMLAVLTTACADRIAPKEVPPLEKNGITYKVPHFGGLMGSIEAYDTKTNQPIWCKQIYVVKYNPYLESDVQDCFITSIEIKDDKMIVKNEKQFEYELDLSSLEVKAITGTLVINRGK